MKLRLKILAGFFTLSAMLAVAGLWAISQINWMSENVENILSNNYKSISAAKGMIKALERQDSAILWIINGENEKYTEIFIPADSAFQAHFRVAESNLTIEGEQKIIDKIRRDYKSLGHSLILLNAKPPSKAWYFDEIHPILVSLMNDTELLLNLNDEQLFKTAQSVTDKAERALMPGIIAIIAAIVFSLIFSYLINYYLIKPIKEITHEVDKFIKVKKNFSYEAETRDEIYELTNSIRLLVSRATDIDNRV